MADNEKDKLLDHEYDGIRELDNHMPRWWVWGFYFTIAFAVFYVIYYHYTGDKSQKSEYDQEMAAVKKSDAPANPTGAPQAEFLKDADSLAAGKNLYSQQTCIGCHAPTLGGLVGPDLTDDFWMHGCSTADIAKSITTGFPQKGMLPFGSGKPLEEKQLLQLISFIASQRGIKQAAPKPVDPAREVKCQIKM
jgi:cytochrome c oxidase cbb3-type subunit III